MIYTKPCVKKFILASLSAQAQSGAALLCSETCERVGTRPYQLGYSCQGELGDLDFSVDVRIPNQNCQPGSAPCSIRVNGEEIVCDSIEGEDCSGFLCDGVTLTKIPCQLPTSVYECTDIESVVASCNTFESPCSERL